MRKLATLSFLIAVAVTLPLHARGKNESYISYDDGGTIVRTGDDNREVDGRVNLPVFPGDEVITNRRGRAEVRLADGNVVAIDRATSVRFRSVLDSYDGESNDTIIELRYGKVAVYRADDARESLRLDTTSGSYFAGREALFSVESDADSRDRVQVFEGGIEVRTPSRTARVKAGESADVDDRGLYNLASDARSTSDDFEHWFLQRAERYGAPNSRYLDRSIAYSDEDLAQHGSWTMINGFGWGWRPYVSAGWRPYYYGSWSRGRSGCLTWVSYEPWGWVPYHYGRWSFDPGYGWFWLPGASYAPAWVYWWYSPGYVGWAPAGWYDCYRPYYDWAYRPYRGGVDFGFGFYGRVRINEVDLRPWTFLDANTILSGRVDRAALQADVVRGRLTRSQPGGYATISGTPARFGRDDARDPATAVGNMYRRGLTGGGGATGSVVPPTDMTPFFRRDAQLPGDVRDRIVRTRPVDGGVTPARGFAGAGSPSTSGGLAPIGSGSVAPIGGGAIAPIGGGSVAPTTGGGTVHRGDDTGWRNSGSGVDRGNGSTTSPRDNNDGGRINRGNGTVTPRNPQESTTPAPQPTWRNRISRTYPGGTENGSDRPGLTPPPAASSPTPAPAQHDDNWRGRIAPREQGGTTPAPADTPRTERPRSVDRGSSDVPRRVIDGIGGTRIYRGGDSSSGRQSTPPPARAPEARPPARESSSPPPPPPPKQEHHDSGQAHRDGGGKIERNKH